MLPVSRLVNVTINLSPLAAQTRSFGVLMIAGDSSVISGLQRSRTYNNIDGVALDFSSTAPEFLASELYFSQVPQPATLMIGRWLRTATPGMLDGGILNSNQQLISNFQSVTSGGMQIPIDGSNISLTGLNFSGAANLNAVAGIITAALGGATCIWNGSEFVVSSGTTGAGGDATGTITLDTNPSVGARATGTITLSGQPANADTVTINSTAVEFVTGSPTGNEVLIGATDTDTANNLQAFLSNSLDAGLSACLYNTIGLVTTVSARLFGTAGNAFTLTKSGTNIAVSGSGTLASGVAPDTITVNGTLITFVSGTIIGGGKVLVGPTNAITAVNLSSYLSASADSNISQGIYSVNANVVTVAAKLVGVAGNSFTLVKSSSHITLSGATLTGGTVGSSVGYATAPVSGTDISTILQLTSALAIALVPGYNAEEPVACVAALANKSAGWYGLMFAASVQPTDSQNLAVCPLIEAQSITRIFGVTIINTNVLSDLVTTDLASLMMAGGFKQSFPQYSQNPYAVASYMGRAFSVNFSGNNTTITLMYKQEPTVVAEDITSSQADTLKAKRCNIFAAYTNDTAIIQYGTMSGPAWFDEIHGLDWLQDAIQTACYNLLYTSTTKIPQTNSGVNQFINTISGACRQGVTNGLIAPGVWNGPAFGSLNTGDYLQAGYYVYAQDIALQSQSDRDARVAPPIQVAIKLAGAIQQVTVLLNVNR